MSLADINFGSLAESCGRVDFSWRLFSQVPLGMNDFSWLILVYKSK